MCISMEFTGKVGEKKIDINHTMEEPRDDIRMQILYQSYRSDKQ